MKNPVPTITIDEPFGTDFTSGGHRGYYLNGDYFFLPMNDGDNTTEIRPWTPIAFKDGFTTDFSMRRNDQVTQELNLDFNALGFYMTLGTFMRQCGSYPTFNENVCKAIGGYPKGTVLRCYKTAKGRVTSSPTSATYVMDVVSMQDNNTKDFVYRAETNPEPYAIGERVDGVVWWKRIVNQTPKGYASVLPDMINCRTFTYGKNKEGDRVSSLGYLACRSLKESIKDPHIVNTLGYSENGKRDTDSECPLTVYTVENMKTVFSGKPYVIPKGIEIVFYPQRRVEV